MIYATSAGDRRKLVTFPVPMRGAGNGALGRSATEEDLTLALSQLREARAAVASSNDRHIALGPSGFYGWRR